MDIVSNKIYQHFCAKLDKINDELTDDYVRGNGNFPYDGGFCDGVDRMQNSVLNYIEDLLENEELNIGKITEQHFPEYFI